MVYKWSREGIRHKTEYIYGLRYWGNHLDTSVKFQEGGIHVSFGRKVDRVDMGLDIAESFAKRILEVVARHKGV